MAKQTFNSIDDARLLEFVNTSGNGTVRIHLPRPGRNERPRRGQPRPFVARHRDNYEVGVPPPLLFKDVHLPVFMVAEMKPRMVDGSVNHSTPPRRLGESPSPLHLVCVQVHECLLPRDGRGTLSCSQPKGGGLGKRQERADPLSDGS